MTVQQNSGLLAGRANPSDLLANISYEVMPLKNAERDVLEYVPTSVPLTVTVTEAKGIETTLALTESLSMHGYSVSPHLPARLFESRGQVVDVVDRLDAAGIRSVFVVGGDARHAAGPFEHAHALLMTMADVGHPFDEVGIGGYPEGHPAIPTEALEAALQQKEPMSTRIISQICFHAETTAAWASGLTASGIDLPVYIGVPGPVNRQKLMRISANIGLGQSVRFLQKQSNLLWRFLIPGGYKPTRLVSQLLPLASRTNANVGGLHIFTFNELRQTEEWRRQLLAAATNKEGR